MELFQLRYFCETAQSQSFSQSAKKLNVSQPALSQAIHKLETELNVQLFTKQGRRRVLTPDGSYLLAEARPLLAGIDALPQKLAANAHKESLTLQLNVLAAWPLISDAIIAYQRIDSELRIVRIENNENKLADITVRTERSAPCNRIASEGEAVFTEPLMLAVPNTPRFKDRASISLEEIKDEKVIMLSRSHSLRKICDDIYAAAGFAPHIVFESDSPATTMRMTTENLGIGFWPAFSWGAIDSRHLKLLRIDGGTFTRDIIISLHTTKQDAKRIRAFYAFLVDYMGNAMRGTP